MKEIKFIGKFKYLKKYGYEFGNFFARNYIAYTKKYSLYKSREICIWKANKTVDFGFGDADGLVIEYLKNIINIKIKSIKFTDGQVFEYKYIILMYDNKLMTLCPKEDFKDFCTSKEDYENWVERYKEIVIYQEDVDNIKELWNNNLIEIIEKE